MAGDFPLETAVVSFWHASSDRFPLLSHLAIWYLSVPTKSVHAERRVSHYTNVSAPDPQRLSASNSANQLMIAKDSKLGSSQQNSDCYSRLSTLITKINICCSEISLYSSTDFLVCINQVPWIISCGACEIWHTLKTLLWSRAFSPLIRLVPAYYCGVQIYSLLLSSMCSFLFSGMYAILFSKTDTWFSCP